MLRRGRSGSRARKASTHSALPMFTKRSVRIIKGKGATCRTCDGTPGKADCSTMPSH